MTDNLLRQIHWCSNSDVTFSCMRDEVSADIWRSLTAYMTSPGTVMTPEEREEKFSARDDAIAELDALLMGVYPHDLMDLYTSTYAIPMIARSEEETKAFHAKNVTNDEWVAFLRVTHLLKTVDHLCDNIHRNSFIDRIQKIIPSQVFNEMQKVIYNMQKGPHLFMLDMQRSAVSDFHEVYAYTPFMRSLEWLWLGCCWSHFKLRIEAVIDSTVPATKYDRLYMLYLAAVWHPFCLRKHAACDHFTRSVLSVVLGNYQRLRESILKSVVKLDGNSEVFDLQERMRALDSILAKY